MVVGTVGAGGLGGSVVITTLYGILCADSRLHNLDMFSLSGTYT